MKEETEIKMFETIYNLIKSEKITRLFVILIILLILGVLCAEYLVTTPDFK